MARECGGRQACAGPGALGIWLQWLRPAASLLPADGPAFPRPSQVLVEQVKRVPLLVLDGIDGRFRGFEQPVTQLYFDKKARKVPRAPRSAQEVLQQEMLQPLDPLPP